MGRLMDIALSVMKEQDRCTGQPSRIVSQELSADVVPAFTRNPESYDINDINDHTTPAVSPACPVEADASGTQRKPYEQNDGPPAHGWRWRSAVLGEEIRLVPDGSPDVDGRDCAGRAIYTVAEVHALSDVTPRHLRLIHQAKSLFGGEVLYPDATDEPLQLRLPEADADN